MIQDVYQLCACGSGKKIKWCCKNKRADDRSLYEKISSGDIPFSARVYSTNGEASSMHIESASVTIGGVRNDLITKPITLTTNGVYEETKLHSAVSLSVPVNGLDEGRISTTGNATAVTKEINKNFGLSIFNGKNKLKASGANGLRVTAIVGFQRNEERKYLCVLFGRKGLKEEINSDGVKNRPHIEVYPDGSGKFVRIKSHCCEISSQSSYNPVTSIMALSSVSISSNELNEVAELKFEYTSTKIILHSIELKNKT